MTRPPFEPVSERDIRIVSAQLGRPARDVVGIPARCVCGAPTVVATAPRLSDGTPFPTLYYLTHPVATAAMSFLEAAQVMVECTELLAADPEVRAEYERAHRDYLADRESIAVVPELVGISAGGMPTRVKCLHALAAHSLSAGPGANPIGDIALERSTWSPAVCQCPDYGVDVPDPADPADDDTGGRRDPLGARRPFAALAKGAAVAAAATVIALVGATPAHADTVRDLEYWLADYGFTTAWNTSRGDGVTVAVIDTGVNGEVAELKGAVTGGTDVSGIGSPDGQTPVGDDPNHGTMVASLLAGRGTGNGNGVIGIAPEADIITASVAFGQDTGATVSNDDQIAEAREVGGRQRRRRHQHVAHPQHPRLARELGRRVHVRVRP